MAVLVLGGTAAIVPSIAGAETRVADDYVAIVLEAEDFVSGDDRWVLTEPGTPTQQDDPDPNHTLGASGGAYLELLPDIRVKHGDPFGPPRGLWAEAGEGPTLTYAADFPEVGRYHAHVRLYSTGSEDNGIHIGLNDEWPESGAEMQGCTAGHKAWRWTSRQRGAGGFACGIDHTAWVTVTETGPQIVGVSAREDGFEIDRVMLIKDRSEGTRVCEPRADQPDSIVCRDGTIETSDELVDLVPTLSASAETLLPGETVELTVTLRNSDHYDVAYQPAVALAFSGVDWRIDELGAGCVAVEEGASCGVGQIPPTGEKDPRVFTVLVEALSEGVLRIDATATADQADVEPENDVVRLDLDVGTPVASTTVESRISAPPESLEVGSTHDLEFSAVNVGEAAAFGAALELRVPEGVSIDGAPADCSMLAETLICELGELDADAARAFSVTVSAEEAGEYAFEASAGADNAGTSDATATLVVIEPVVDGGEDGTVDGGDDAGSDDSGSGDSGTGGDGFETGSGTGAGGSTGGGSTVCEASGGVDGGLDTGYSTGVVVSTNCETGGGIDGGSDGGIDGGSGGGTAGGTGGSVDGSVDGGTAGGADGGTDGTAEGGDDGTTDDGATDGDTGIDGGSDAVDDEKPAESDGGSFGPLAGIALLFAHGARRRRARSGRSAS